jgi:hypothetical protein
MIALPTKTFEDSFAVYKLHTDYFGLTNGKRDYMLMTVADVQRCTAGSITVCPADKSLLDVQTLTCESEFYFQKTLKNGICRRSLLIHYETPTLVRHQDV